MARPIISVAGWRSPSHFDRSNNQVVASECNISMATFNRLLLQSVLIWLHRCIQLIVPLGVRPEITVIEAPLPVDGWVEEWATYADEDVAFADAVEAFRDLVDPQPLAVLLGAAALVLSLQQVLLHLPRQSVTHEQVSAS